MPEETRRIIDAARAALDAALGAGRRITDGGKGIDEHQVHAERLAYAATEVAAAEALAAYAADAGDTITDAMAAAFAAEVADRLRSRIEGHREDFDVPDAVLAKSLGDGDVQKAVRAAQH